MLLKIRIPATQSCFYFTFNAYHEVENALRLYFPYFEYTSFCTLTKTDYHLCIDTDKCVIKNYSKILVQFTISSDRHLFREMIRIIKENVLFNKNTIILHAMTMKYHENIIAFLAQSGTGKTTLAAYLSQDVNWQIISEDMLIVNYNTLDLYASARKLLLRENALEILCKYGFPLEYEYNKIMNRYLLKECSEGSSGNNIIQKLTHIAFLERSLKKTPAITTIHEDSVGDILVNTLCPYQIKNNLTGAHELNKKCSKFHIQYEDMSLLKSALQNFL